MGSILYFLIRLGIAYCIVTIGVNVGAHVDKVIVINGAMMVGVFIWLTWAYEFLSEATVKDFDRISDTSELLFASALMALLPLLFLNVHPEHITALGWPETWTYPLREISTIDNFGLLERNMPMIWGTLQIVGVLSFVISVMMVLYILWSWQRGYDLPNRWDPELRARNAKKRVFESDSEALGKVQKLTESLISEKQQHAKTKNELEAANHQIDALLSKLEAGRETVERLEAKIVDIQSKGQAEIVHSSTGEPLPPGYSVRPEDHPLKARKA
jgi:hypothetical protein